jgi:hypothetical protein
LLIVSNNPPARVFVPKPSEALAYFHTEDKSRNPRLAGVSKPDAFGVGLIATVQNAWPLS